MLFKEGSVRTGVLQHFYISPYLRREGQKEGESIHFWNGLFNGSPKIPKSVIWAIRGNFCGRSLKFDVTYQPASLKGIASNLISANIRIIESKVIDIHLISTLCQKIFGV